MWHIAISEGGNVDSWGQFVMRVGTVLLIVLMSCSSSSSYSVLTHEEIVYLVWADPLRPRIGPFRGLAFNNPTPQTEDLFIESINTTVDQYRALLEKVRTNTLVLANCDFDSGQPTKAAEYSLTDDTYAKLLARLSERRFDLTSSELRANILGFYSDLSVPIETKKDRVRWQGVLTELDQLKVASGPTVADRSTP